MCDRGKKQNVMGACCFFFAHAGFPTLFTCVCPECLLVHRVVCRSVVMGLSDDEYIGFTRLKFKTKS